MKVPLGIGYALALLQFHGALLTAAETVVAPTCPPPEPNITALLEATKQRLFYNYADPLVSTFKRTPEILSFLGYNSTTFSVTGRNGYITTLYRISKGKYNNNFARREPVLIHHGVFLSSADFLRQLVDIKNLPLYLVENGYDVWLINGRGTSYSRGHVNLTDTQEQYWDFSFDEMGRYDLPAQIDTVLSTTGFSNLSYIGHSMGCAIFLACMNYNPSYAAKVRKFVALAPGGFSGNTTSAIFGFFTAFPDPILETTANVVAKGRFGSDEFAALLRTEFPIRCTNSLTEVDTCLATFYSVSGYSPNTKREGQTILRWINQYPDSTSMRCITHFLQIIRSGTFDTQARYNVGSLRIAGNAIYDQFMSAFGPNKGLFPYVLNLLSSLASLLPAVTLEKPSAPYNLATTNMPTLVIVGKQDSITVPCDVFRTFQAIGATSKNFLLVDNTGHLDVLFMKDAMTKIYEPVLTFLNEGTQTIVAK